MVLCVVRIEITDDQHAALLFACKRLGLSWPALRTRVQAACQDAAAKRITGFSQLAQRLVEQRAGYPDCGQCWAMRAETCARCGQIVEEN